MLVLEGTKAKKGDAFLARGAGIRKFVIVTLHRDETVSYIPEKMLGAYKRKALRYGDEPVRVANDVFLETVFTKRVESKAEKAEREQAERTAELEKKIALDAEVRMSHEDALKLDLLFDAARSNDTDALLAKLKCLIDSAREEGYENGYEIGYDDGYRRGNDEGYSLGSSDERSTTYLRYERD